MTPLSITDEEKACIFSLAAKLLNPQAAEKPLSIPEKCSLKEKVYRECLNLVSRLEEGQRVTHADFFQAVMKAGIDAESGHVTNVITRLREDKLIIQVAKHRKSYTIAKKK